jgi:hypothetical protein
MTTFHAAIPITTKPEMFPRIHGEHFRIFRLDDQTTTNAGVLSPLAFFIGHVLVQAIKEPSGLVNTGMYVMKSLS